MIHPFLIFAVSISSLHNCSTSKGHTTPIQEPQYWQPRMIPSCRQETWRHPWPWWRKEGGQQTNSHGSDEEERRHGEVLLRRRSGELWRDFRPGPLFICNRAPVRVTPAQSVTDSSLWTRMWAIRVCFVPLNGRKRLFCLANEMFYLTLIVEYELKFMLSVFARRDKGYWGRY